MGLSKQEHSRVVKGVTVCTDFRDGRPATAKMGKGNPKLLKQACDGLTRVISVKYGTPYAQKAGRIFIGLYSKK